MPVKWDPKTGTWVGTPTTVKSGDKDRRAKVETKRLQKTVDVQRKRLAALKGEEAPTDKVGDSPTVLERIFDVLSRPNYAVAETYRQAYKNRDKSLPTQTKSAISGMAAGFSGKEKTDFDKVLGEAKVLPGGWQRAALGFGLDVLTDPTTYVGGGIVKGVGEGTLKAVGAKAAKKAFTSPEAEKIGRKAVVEAIAERRAAKTLEKEASKKANSISEKVLDLSGNADDLAEIAEPKVAKAVGNLQNAKNINQRKKALKQIAEDAKNRFAMEQGTKAEQLAREAGQGKLQLKILGKPVLQSESAYRGLASLGKPLASTQTVQSLNEMFRTASLFPEGINSMKRMFENRGVANFEDIVHKDVRPAFHGLSKADKRAVSHAIEGGYQLGGTAGEAQTKAKALLDLIYDREVEMGLHADDGKIENYVYHTYKNSKHPAARRFKNARKKYAVGSPTPGFEKARAIETLQEAKRIGLKPVEEIDDIVTLRLAKHHETVSRYDFVRAVESEFGSIAPNKKLAQELGLEKLDAKTAGRFLSNSETHFPPEIANTLRRIDDLHINEEAADKFLRTFDKVQNAWKFMATAANPGHHIRNLMGDFFLNYEDGVVNPEVYYKSARLLKQVLGNSEKVKSNILQVGNVTLKGEDVWRLFRESGAKSGFFRTEFGKEGTGLATKIRNLSENREDFARLAHFMDALRKEGKGLKVGAKQETQLVEIAKRAGQRVKKYNIDYGDLTSFEKQYAKRIIPFYTWLRKNIPLQIETLALRPGRLAVVPKSFRAIENLLGTDENEKSSIGSTEIIPRWIREMASVKLVGEGEGKNAIYWAPSLPVADLGRFAEGGREGILRELLASTSPAIRTPVELAYGEEAYSGRPIKDVGQYASGFVPSVRTIKGVRESTSGKSDRSALIRILNYMTGAGLQEVTETSKQGELRRLQDPVQQGIRKEREKIRSGR